MPSLERLEQFALLANIASFVGPNTSIVLDPGDGTGHTAFGFPGMFFSIQVNVGGYRSTRSISYTVTPNSVDRSSTFDTTTGNVIMDSGHSYNGGGLQTSFDLACPKDASPAPVTIQITAIADTFNPNPNAQPVTLTVMVKGVDVQSFTIADDNNQSAATTPLWFGPTTAGAPDLDGTAFSIEFSNGTIPGKRTGLHSGIGMYAKVTNNTAYDLDIGFVQVISFNTSSRYTDGITGQAKVGNNVLDIDKTNTNFMYQLPDRVPSGATRNLPLGGIGGKDLPVMQSPMRIAYTFSTAYLSSMQYNLQAQTSPTLYGGTMPQGTMPNPGPPVSGYPIALSTASWQFNSTATNGPNTSNPGAADITSTQNPGNWSTSLGTSAGAYPAVRPGPNLG